MLVIKWWAQEYKHGGDIGEGTQTYFTKVEDP